MPSPARPPAAGRCERPRLGPVATTSSQPGANNRSRYKMPAPAGGPLSSSGRTGRHARFAGPTRLAREAAPRIPRISLAESGYPTVHAQLCPSVAAIFLIRAKYEMNSLIVINFDSVDAAAILWIPTRHLLPGGAMAGLVGRDVIQATLQCSINSVEMASERDHCVTLCRNVGLNRCMCIY